MASFARFVYSEVPLQQWLTVNIQMFYTYCITWLQMVDVMLVIMQSHVV